MWTLSPRFCATSNSVSYQHVSLSHAHKLSHPTFARCASSVGLAPTKVNHFEAFTLVPKNCPPTIDRNQPKPPRCSFPRPTARRSTRYFDIQSINTEGSEYTDVIFSQYSTSSVRACSSPPRTSTSPSTPISTSRTCSLSRLASPSPRAAMSRPSSRGNTTTTP